MATEVKGKDRPLFDGKDETFVLQKLEEAFTHGVSDQEELRAAINFFKSLYSLLINSELTGMKRRYFRGWLNWYMSSKQIFNHLPTFSRPAQL